MGFPDFCPLNFELNFIVSLYIYDEINGRKRKKKKAKKRGGKE